MKLIAFLVVCLISLGAMAQPRLPDHYFWKKMPNGLEVVVIENPKVPLATIEIAVKNGAFTEGPEFSGLSHLFEHMFFKANRDYPDQEAMLKRIQELGAIFNGTTSEERVNYFFTFHKDSLDAGLKFMNAAIRFPIYRTEDMKTERPVVDGEFQRAESDPGFLLDYEAQKKLWGDLMTRKNPIGDHNIINTATPEKMMTIKDKYYFPNNSLLIIGGDVQHDQAFSYAEKIYGDWQPSSFDPFQKYPIPDFKPLNGSSYFVKESSLAQTPYIIMYWQGPDTRTDSAATIAGAVFGNILSLNASKWQQALVDKGLATYAGFNYQLARYVGPIQGFLVPNPNKLKECVDEVERQVKMFANDDYFSDEELATAKEIMARNDIRAGEKPSDLPHRLSRQWTSASFEYGTDYLANCKKVTRTDIHHFLEKYVIGKPHVAGMIISPDMNKQFKPEAFFKPGS